MKFLALFLVLLSLASCKDKQKIDNNCLEYQMMADTIGKSKSEKKKIYLMFLADVEHLQRYQNGYLKRDSLGRYTIIYGPSY